MDYEKHFSDVMSYLTVPANKGAGEIHNRLKGDNAEGSYIVWLWCSRYLKIHQANNQNSIVQGSQTINLNNNQPTKKHTTKFAYFNARNLSAKVLRPTFQKEGGMNRRRLVYFLLFLFFTFYFRYDKIVNNYGKKE